jgi:DNA-binding XRE family transcriptional regulator
MLPMTTFADSLKKEIARVARKELRDELGALRKTSLQQRSEIAALRKLLKTLQTQVNRLGRTRAEPAREAPAAGAAAVALVRGKPGRKVVFTAERLKTQRARLGLTQEQAARLLGVSSLSIWKWESGGAVPRASRVPKILERLALGKREALALVAPEAAEAPPA